MGGCEGKAQALVTSFLSPGTMGGLYNDETTAPEDVNKWTVDAVCNFVGGLSGCGEYARVRGAAGPWN